VEAREAAVIAAGVRRVSTFACFLAWGADVLAAGLDPFREAALAGFAFKRIDLAVTTVRLAAFFADFGLSFAFIAMSPATYTDYAS
jgi:hypothetical protein